VRWGISSSLSLSGGISIGNTFIILNWNAPTFNGGANITNYYVYYNSNNIF
jgi:hypothetical protein